MGTLPSHMPGHAGCLGAIGAVQSSEAPKVRLLYSISRSTKDSTMYNGDCVQAHAICYACHDMPCAGAGAC